MNETTPHDPVRHADARRAPSLPGRRFVRRSGAGHLSGHLSGPLPGPLPAQLAESNLFEGLRIVLHECDRRAALLRCLTSLRWLAQRGAEVVLFDGSRSRSSVDGSLVAVKRRFPFVAIGSPANELGVELGSNGILEHAAAPLTVDHPMPRWVLALSADFEVDRFQVQALLRELAELPEGSLLVPGIVGLDGCADGHANANGAGVAARAGAWLARRSDLASRPLHQLTVHASYAASVLATRPVRER